MLGLQAIQKSNRVCVHTKPPDHFHLLCLETVLKFLWQKWRFQTILLRLGVNITANCDFSAPFVCEHSLNYTINHKNPTFSPWWLNKITKYDLLGLTVHWDLNFAICHNDISMMLLSHDVYQTYVWNFIHVDLYWAPANPCGY